MVDDLDPVTTPGPGGGSGVLERQDVRVGWRDRPDWVRLKKSEMVEKGEDRKKWKS